MVLVFKYQASVNKCVENSQNSTADPVTALFEQQKAF